MVGIVDPSVHNFFIEHLTKSNWLSKPLTIGHFQIGDYLILRLTHSDFTESFSFEKVIRKASQLASRPTVPIILIEGNIHELLFSRVSYNFSYRISECKFWNYVAIVQRAFVDYKINVVTTLNKTMSLAIIKRVERNALAELNIDFLSFESEINGLSAKKYTRIVTFLSAHYAQPFEKLSKREIIAGLNEVKIPGIGKNTIKTLESRLSQTSSNILTSN